MAAVVPQVCFGSCKEPQLQSRSVRLSIGDGFVQCRAPTVSSHEQVEDMLVTVQRRDV